jgi:acyl transferase domain-containing protein
VHLRGQLFEEVPPGGMLSVSAAPEEVEEAVRLDSLELDLGVVNAPENCVLSGTDEAVEEAGRRLDEAEIDYKRIPIRIAAHSRLVEPILKRFGDYLESIELSAPSLPIISNHTGTWLTDEEATDPDYWVRHLRGTVRFDTCIRTLKEESRVYLEVGPARILGSLARLQDPSLHTVSSLPHGKEDVAAEDWATLALGSLWVAGVEPDWSAVHAGAYRRRVSLPTYPFDRKRHWIEPGSKLRPEEKAAEPVGSSLPAPAGTTNGTRAAAAPNGDALALVARQIEVMRAQLRAMGGAANSGANGAVVPRGPSDPKTDPARVSIQDS